MTTRERLAGLISNVLNPFVVSTGVIILLALESAAGTADALKWVAISLVLSVLPVFSVVFYLVRRKKLDGIFISQRQQRTRLYLLAGALAVFGCLVLYYLAAPELLQATFTAGLASIAVFAVINLYWKISLHTSFMAGAASIITIVYGFPGALTILLLLPVAWARTQMKLHSLAQVVVAAVLAAAIVTAVFRGFGL
ncbi:MAG: hypothetical protein A2137_07915 [Chloroflexi bacterium RBG_16_58_8]|nr:MAG: hypothetical protein A2137_07915 [Chloroflexi bacterium RBG_16_58_8]